MKTAISCGGTGGHIFPGLAVAEELKARGHNATLWLAGKGIETVSAEGWNDSVVTVYAQGFSSSFGVRSVATAFGLLFAIFRCVREMKKARPDALLAMGSYASVGPVLAARLLGIPVVLHEANVVPGRAVSFLSKYAAAIAVSFEKTRAYFPRCVLTGFPLRKQLWSPPPPDRILPQGPFTILVTGGSQGAHTINELASEAVCRLYEKGIRIQVVHITGTKDEAAVKIRYEKAKVPHAVYGFLRDMRQAYAVADLALCRAGAGTCAELAALAVPALLVPLPGAPRDHQTANARAMEEAGLADAVAEKNLGVERLVDYIENILSHPEKLEKMRETARSRRIRDAVPKLADLVEEVAQAAFPQA